jgi:mannose-6-phosphate isomerase-like protein (cupin superfamily)
VNGRIVSITHVVPRDMDSVREDSNNLSFRQIVNANSYGPDLSVTWVEIDGTHRRLSTNQSTRVYYLLEGSFAFHTSPDVAILANAGDVIVIPRCQPYFFSGTGKYLVINGPAFQEGDDVYQE